MKKYFEKHSRYFSILWTISVTIGGIVAVYQWVMELFNAAYNGDFISFILGLILQSVIMGLSTIIGGATIFLILVILTILPYLVIRGLAK